jgi:hypothetical protein
MSTFTYPIFYLLADIFEIFIIYRYMDLFFGWKQHTKVTYFAFVYYFLSTGILHLIIDAPIFNLIFAISAISFVTCTYRTRLWKKICVVLFLYCYMAVVELIVGNITGYAKTDMIGEGSYQNASHDLYLVSTSAHLHMYRFRIPQNFLRHRYSKIF